MHCAKARSISTILPSLLLLLNLNAVVGVTGFSNPDGSLDSVGIQCALCHSTVDNSLLPGICHRLDGWANRTNLQPVAHLLDTDVATVQTVLNAWGPGNLMPSYSWTAKDSGRMERLRRL
jgi:hypothetical protein